MASNPKKITWETKVASKPYDKKKVNAKDLEDIKEAVNDHADLLQGMLENPPQDGNDGASAFQLAANNGFVGTEAEWLASLKADSGEPVDLAAYLTSEQAAQTYATPAQVATEVAKVIGAAPAAFDTLKEVADYIASDQTGAAAMTAAIGNKQDKEAGKGLSSNDYTTQEKNKAAGLIPNYWLGKNVLILGDSFVQDNYYIPFLAPLRATIINKGVGNTTVTPGYKTVGQSYWDRLQTTGYLTTAGMPDMVIIQTTVNEPFGQSGGGPVPIGTINDSLTATPTTYYGALQQVLLKVFAECPTARIVLTSAPVILAGGSRGTLSTQRGFRDATLAVAQKYSVPFFDTFMESGFTFERNAQYLLPDQVHPSALGGAVLGRYYMAKISQL